MLAARDKNLAATDLVALAQRGFTRRNSLRAHHAQSLQPFARGLADSINKLDFAHAADLCDALLAQLPAAPSAQP
jgi:hypothetical protein